MSAQNTLLDELSNEGLEQVDSQALQVYMGPSSTRQPYSMAPCGAARWLHLHSGRMLARMHPCMDSVLAAYSLHHHTCGHRALIDVLDCAPPQEVILTTGQALAVPAGWLLSLEFQEPCVVIGAVPVAVEEHFVGSDFGILRS